MDSNASTFSPSSSKDVLVEKFPPTARKRRATVACTRCRRYRSKCIHAGSQPPCISCRDAGSAVAETCRFIGRGGSELPKANSRNREEISFPASHTPIAAAPAPNSSSGENQHTTPEAEPTDESETLWDLLPPHEEVIEACKVFINCYFQLGFIPKQLFLDRLEHDKESVSVFLLLGILCVSARFTPSLVKRYGGHSKAMRTFVERAEKLVPVEIYKPTLESIQAFILLGSAEWALGDRNRSLIHLGVASTMVGMLRLHREETYSLPNDASPEDIINVEMARRTLWVMGMQLNLFSGGKSPVPFSLLDITALLPCEESEFVFGLVPSARAALPSSKAALEHPDLINSPSRSLFATLIQAHNLWGRVARGACLDEKDTKQAPVKLWESSSEYSKLSNALNQWEAGLSKTHRWSEWYLRSYRAENLDLAYVSIFMALRLSNVVLRRTHLEEMKEAALDKGTTPLFWANMSHELFTNVLSLHEGINAYLAQRSPVEGFPPLLAFCVYVCGSSASHLWKCPQLCPRLALQAESVVHWSLKVLVELKEAWPVAIRWHKALEMASAGLSPLDPQEIIVEYSQNKLLETMHSTLESISKSTSSAQSALGHHLSGINQMPPAYSAMDLLATGVNSSMIQPLHGYSINMHSDPFSILDQNLIPLDNFESELSSYLQGDVHFGMSDDWNI